MTRESLCVLLLLLGLSARARAQARTRPAADSPKSALHAQDAAAKAGNVEADLDFYQADGEQQKKLARAIAEGDVAVARLEKTVGDRFGKELATAAVRAAGTEDNESISAATENVSGDHATVQFEHQQTPVPMVRSDGKWKVSIGEWIKGASDHDIDQLISKLAELSAGIDHITDLVACDKFRSGEGVRDHVQELHDRLFGAVAR
jgi:hypothetical protein